MKTGLTLYATRGTVALKPTAGNTAKPMLLSGVLVDRVAVRGLGFDGGGRDHANPNPLVTLYRATNTVIDRTDRASARGNAILGSNVASSGVINSTFIDIGNH